MSGFVFNVGHLLCVLNTKLRTFFNSFLLATDTYSSMLCQLCLNGLQNAHNLILKALESYKYFQDTNNFLACQMIQTSNIEDDVKYTPTEFETILVEKMEDEEPIIQDHFVYENSEDEEQGEDELLVEPIKAKRTKTKGPQDKCIRKDKTIEKGDRSNVDKTVKVKCSKIRKKLLGKSKSAKQKVVQSTDKTKENESVLNDNIEEMKTSLNDNIEESDAPVVPKVKEKYKERKKPRMCSICCKCIIYTEDLYFCGVLSLVLNF